MTIRVNTAAPVTPRVRVIARQAADTTPTTPVKTNTPATEPQNPVAAFLDKTGVAEALKKAINAKSSDEVVAAMTAGITQLLITGEGNSLQQKISNLDKKLHEDFRGTIEKNVSNETAKKVLLTLGDVFGDKVASNLISAGAGAIAGTTVELLKDEKFRKMYNEDPKAFGLELAKRTGKNFGVALAAAWGTAKLEELLPKGLKWLAHTPVVSGILGKLFGTDKAE